MLNSKLTKILTDHKLWLKDTLKGTRADLSRTDLSGTNLSEANLSGADLSRADLSGANLSKAILYRANLSKADLSGADLSEANLSRANLSGADLIFTCVKVFCIGGHMAYLNHKFLTIGCEEHTIEHWMREGKNIAKQNGYTDKQAYDYGNLVWYINEFLIEGE